VRRALTCPRFQIFRDKDIGDLPAIEALAERLQYPNVPEVEVELLPVNTLLPSPGLMLPPTRG